tara:strand:- start:31 stop:990 length:960 start_codon:yes stop_codon:yes gene_type:complete
MESLLRRFERNRQWIRVVGTLLIAVSVVWIFFLFSTPESTYPKKVEIPFGATVAEVANQMKYEKVVRSSDLLFLWLMVFGQTDKIKAGEHIFIEPLQIWEVGSHLSSYTPLSQSISVTFPEGFSVEKYAQILYEASANFDPQEFVEKGTSFEGYLFPDTYFIPVTYSTEDVLVLLTETFNSKVPDLNHEFLSPEEVIILASIVEREANSFESMKMVSGILQNRLEIGMPLQTDATLEYILDKSLTELTRADLEFESPYNTYTHNSLTPTPIGNPGLAAIDAVLYPHETNHLYYITDNIGTFHYASTYEEHLQNVEVYLR